MNPEVWLDVVIVALAVGSFLGVLVTRLPAGQEVVMARSACPACGHRLGVADLIPLVSFIALKGRCRYCNARIDLIHPAIEIASLAVALLAATRAGNAIDLMAYCVLGFGLLALGWIDACHFWLPDCLILPLLLLGLATTFWQNPAALLDHAVGAALGFGVFAGLDAAYRRWRGRNGLGLGDAKLLALAGAWVGWLPLPLIVLYAALLGLLIAGTLHLAGWRKMTLAMQIPFGTCLAPFIFLADIHLLPGSV
jgi:leader peptidase (prepilin peptidase)/N-methyltransferase